MKTLAIGNNAATAKTAANLSDVFNTTNCSSVTLADGSYKSWRPGATFNAINAFEVNKGYIIVMKQSLGVSQLMTTSDIGGSATPTFQFANNSTLNDLDVKFVDTNGTTVLNTQSVLHSALGLTGDLTPYLGKKIRLVRSTFNFKFYLIINSAGGGIEVTSGEITSTNPALNVTIPADTTSISLAVDNYLEPISARIIRITGTNMARAEVFTGAPVAADLLVTVHVSQDPTSGSTAVTSFDVTIPAGQSAITHDFSIGSLANDQYLHVSALDFTSNDFYSFL